MMQLNTLWIGGSLPPLQRLCLASAVATGCPVRLFSYEPLDGVPDGIELADAREVLGLYKLIRHRKSQSVALFSDRFRYEILGLSLGAWIDTDLLFLKSPEAVGDCLVGLEDPTLVGSCFIWIRPGHPLIEDLRRHAADENPVPPWFPLWRRSYLSIRKTLGWPTHVSDLDWGVIGPNLLTWLLQKHGMFAAAQPVSWASGLPWDERHNVWDSKYDWQQWISMKTIAVHLWNYGLSQEERFQRPEPGSLLQTVAETCGFQWPDNP
jgi:hypothetical protein